MRQHTGEKQIRLMMALMVIIQICSVRLYAQHMDYRDLYHMIDSLEHILQTNPPEGADLLAIYRDLAWGNLGSNYEKVKYYSRKGIPLARQLNFPKVESFFHQWLGISSYHESKYDSAMFHYNNALDAAERMKTNKGSSGKPYYTEADIDHKSATIYGDIGNVYNIRGQYHEAVEYYTKTWAFSEKHEWSVLEINTLENIAEMYLSMDNYERAEAYLMQAADIAYAINDSLRIANNKKRLSRLYLLQQKDYDKALEYARDAYDYFSKHPEDGIERAIALNTLASAYLDGFDDYTQAKEYVKQALETDNLSDEPREKSVSLRILAAIHLKRGRWRQAEQTALEALVVDDSEPANTMGLYEILSKAYAHLDNADKAGEYFDKYSALQVSYSNRHYQSAIREMEVKYDTQKKDLLIEAFAREKRLYLFLTIAGCGLALLGFILLFYRNRLHRRQKQLLAAQVALESEAAERSRLAKDLHDGLGSMLSLVQVNLKDVKGWNGLEREDAEHFGKALDMLGDSITELRRVAHHIMPEALTKHGLKTSLQDFILSVPGADFHFFGEEKRLDGNLEAVLYRSAHELVNNALKHAAATHIDVQLVQQPDRVSLTVTDNGKGFDTSQETKGMGLKNIRNRISVYGGQMHILSDNGQGTEVNVELRVES